MRCAIYKLDKNNFLNTQNDTEAANKIQLQKNRSSDLNKALSHFLDDKNINPEIKNNIIEFLRSHLARVNSKKVTNDEKNYLIYKSAEELKDFLITGPEITDLSDRIIMLHEWLGFADPTLLTILTIHYNLCLGSILQSKESNTPVVKKIVDELLNFKSFGVFLATELSYGNNLYSLETRADYDHETKTFVINTPTASAQKYMPNTGQKRIAKVACLMARLYVDNQDCGVFPFIVRLRGEGGKLMEGVSVKPLGDKPVYVLDNAVTSFKNVRVPFEHGLLGEDSRINEAGEFKTTESNARTRFLKSVDRVQMGKLCLSASVTKGLQAALKIAFTYSDQRKTFAPKQKDVTIFSYRTHKNSLFTDLSKYFAMRSLYNEVKELKSNSDDKFFENSVYTLKYFSSDKTILILNNLRERLGAQGMFNENRIFEYLVSTHGTATAEGDNVIIKSKLIKEMLTTDTYSKPKPVKVGWLKQSITNIEYISYLLHKREHKLFSDLKSKFAVDKALGHDLFASWNKHSIQAMELAEAHAVRYSFDSFVKRIAECEDVRAKAVLTDLCKVFSLSHLQETSGWHLVHKTMSPRAYKKIQVHIDQAIDRLYPYRHNIIDSFDIPNDLIGSPLLGNYIKNFDFLNK